MVSGPFAKKQDWPTKPEHIIVIPYFTKVHTLAVDKAYGVKLASCVSAPSVASFTVCPG
jgi:hypothetical protein